jgi:hypothetical protein
VLFDTIVAKDSFLQKVSGDMQWAGNAEWFGPMNGVTHGHALKAKFQNANTATRLRILARRVVTPTTFMMFAGDRGSCGLDYEWEF